MSGRGVAAGVPDEAVVPAAKIVAPPRVRPQQHSRAIREDGIVEIGAGAYVEPGKDPEPRVLRSVIIAVEEQV